MTRPAHERERAVGIEWYVSDADGTGGRIRVAPEDFRVRERERFDVEPADADSGSYPHLVFRATLRAWDTNDFADALASKLGISRERVSWAGTKDKHAVTTQLFSVKAPDLAPDDLPDLRDADLAVVGRAGRPVLFGDLAGNAFEIRVREADRPEQAEAVTRELRAFAAGDSDSDGPAGESTPVGVPNYFGQQRFGTLRPVTHRVGLEIVRGNWEGAVLAYVTGTGESEPEETRAAREFARETRDWTAALDRLPGRLRHERAMVHRLAEEGAETPADFRRALAAVPTNLQRLFVNAAQSFAFNRMVSRRLDRGLPFVRAVAGDVVCFADADAPGDLVLPDTDRRQRVDGARLASVNRHCERGRAFVTAPLVGTETDLADGEQGEIERAVLDGLDIEPADFDLPGEFHSTGTRRAILVRTDLSVSSDGNGTGGTGDVELSFGLPKGSYATVLVREYLKCHPERLG